MPLCLLLLALPLASGQLIQSSLARLVSRLSRMGNTELNLVSDFASEAQRALPRLLARTATLMPVSVYSVDGLGDKQTRAEGKCPLFVLQDGDVDVDTEQVIEDSSVFIEEPLLFNQNYHSSVFVWISSIDVLRQFLLILDHTVMNCTQRIDVGMYNHGNRFYFFSEGNSVLAETVFSHAMMRRHPHVAVIKDVGDGFAFYAFDFFQDETDFSRPRVRPRFFLPKLSDVSVQAEDLFTSQSDFGGRVVRLGTLPWAHHVLADSIATDDPEYSPTNLFRNYAGWEVDLATAAAKTLNFRLQFVNPADQLWGDLTNGTWSGFTGQIVSQSVDWITSDIMYGFARIQMMEISVPFETDFLGFIVPLGERRPRYLALILPFDLLVWLTLVPAFLLCSLLLWLVATLEKHVRLSEREYLYWDNINSATWYCFGTFFAQSLSRDKESTRTPAIRCQIACWALFGMIVTMAYAGSIKAFLTNPEYLKPITTLAEVVQSGLPWQMVLYGEEEEQMMKESADPVIRTIWTRKTVVEYQPVPDYEDVYRGRAVFIDYKTGAEMAVKTRYSTPDGHPLVLLAPNPIFRAKPVGWGFDRFNPGLADTINRKVIERVIEAGLIPVWKDRTCQRMKELNLAAGIKSVQVAAKNDENAPLTALDYQGLAYVGAILLLVALATFLAELITRAMAKASKKGYKRSKTMLRAVRVT